MQPLQFGSLKAIQINQHGNSALTDRINSVEAKVDGVRDDLGARVKSLEDKPDNRKDIDKVQERLDIVEKFISEKQAVEATGGGGGH